MLSAGSIVLFAITSRLDEALGQISTLNTPVVDSLLFAGSPHGARSLLSTIAAGWATVMGVAFSVTLISLQLSITKHTAEVVSEFENDKLNQITLGWFVSTVIYSLLVLKTVRTGEDEITQIFTPVIGVNVAVFLSIIALFIFVSFIHNVSKYLKPPLLINKIQRHVVKAVDGYGQRQIDRNASFIVEGSPRRKLFDVKSPMNGVLRRIKLRELRSQAANYKELQQIWIEFHISQGEDVRKGSTVATVYTLDQNDQRQSVMDEDLNRLEVSVINAVDINRDRDLLTDPDYGVEIMRNIAIQAISQSDINSIKACVSGLFEILAHAFRVSESQTKPVITLRSVADNTTKIGIVAHLNERPIFKIILTELATIYRASLENPVALSAIINHYNNEYQLAALDLLDSNKIDHFALLTEWSSDVGIVLKKQQQEGPFSSFGSGEKESPYRLGDAILHKFRKRLAENYPYAVEVFDIHTKKNFVSEA